MYRANHLCISIIHVWALKISSKSVISQFQKVSICQYCLALVSRVWRFFTQNILSFDRLFAWLHLFCHGRSISISHFRVLFHECSCTTFLMTMSLICSKMSELTDETHFHHNYFTGSRPRFDTSQRTTRKWLPNQVSFVLSYVTRSSFTLF